MTIESGNIEISNPTIVPLERFLLPEALNGAQGDNRSPNKPFIEAFHDLDAITCWLSRVDSHTYRSYKREAERLLLWSIIEQKKPLASLNSVDMAAYRSFLKDPRPVKQWIGPPQKKGTLNWKPFTGPLSNRSIRHAETVINGLFSFLVGQHYLLHNPLLALPKLRNPKGHATIGVNRSFTAEQWRLITDFADEKVKNTEGKERMKWIRTRLIIRFGYATGLRLHELAQAKLNDIYCIERGEMSQYWISVLGKGQKMREVPVPVSAYALLSESYQAVSQQQIEEAPSEYPLIPSLRKPTGTFITPLAIHKTLKKFFELAAKALNVSNPVAADKLSRASAHWLRHTYGTIAVDKAIPLTMIRDNLGHSSIATTSQYAHADEDARHKAFKDF